MTNQKPIIKKLYHHFALIIVEMVRLGNLKRFKLLQRIDPTSSQRFSERANKALEQGKGLCILTGHLGNWEIAGCYMASGVLNARNQTIVKSMKSGIGEYILYKIRDCNGVETIEKTDDVVRKVIKALRKNEIVTFVLDQHITPTLAARVDFMGHPCHTMASLATIVRKTKSPVIPAGLFRNADLKSYTIESEEPLDYIEAETPQEEIAANTQGYNHAIERLLTNYPEQWIWMHKRWRD